jgi:hypothetical protein
MTDPPFRVGHGNPGIFGIPEWAFHLSLSAQKSAYPLFLFLPTPFINTFNPVKWLLKLEKKMKRASPDESGEALCSARVRAGV